MASSIKFGIGARRRAMARLKGAGLAPTKQRVASFLVLFEGPLRHVTTQAFFSEMRESGHMVSLATAYNVLQIFAERGLLKRVTSDPLQLHYDTNTADHHHFYNSKAGELIDIPLSEIQFASLPELPAECRYSIEVTIHVRDERGDTELPALGKVSPTPR